MQVEQVAGLAQVVATVEVHVRELVAAAEIMVLRQRADHVDDTGRVGSSSGELWSLARAATRCSGMPCPSVATERFVPCLPAA